MEALSYMRSQDLTVATEVASGHADRAGPEGKLYSAFLEFGSTSADAGGHLKPRKVDMACLPKEARDRHWVQAIEQISKHRYEVRGFECETVDRHTHKRSSLCIEGGKRSKSFCRLEEMHCLNLTAARSKRQAGLEALGGRESRAHDILKCGENSLITLRDQL